MKANKRRLIGSAAEELRRLLNITDGNFDIEEVVSRLNGKIEYFSGYDEGCAEDVMKGGGQVQTSKQKDENASFVIRINEDNVKMRQRFSIAYELGHLFLHMRYFSDKWDSLPNGEKYNWELGSYSVKEEEANEFAGAFLMPEQLFIKKAIETGSESRCSLEKIAEFFNVSVSDAFYRGRNLGLWR